MYRVLILLLVPFLLGAGIQSQHMRVLAGRGAGAPADPCLCAISTYLSCYTGDFTGNVRQICFNSGAGDKLGVDVGTIEVTSAFVTITGPDEWLEFASTADDILNPAVGTIWLTVFIDVVTQTGEITFLENGNAGNSDWAAMRVNSNGTLRGSYRQAGTDRNVETTATIVEQTNTRVSYSWDQPTDRHRVCIAAACVENDPGNINGLGVWTELRIGEERNGLVSHTVRISDITVFSTYDAADPSP